MTWATHRWVPATAAFGLWLALAGPAGAQQPVKRDAAAAEAEATAAVEAAAKSAANDPARAAVQAWRAAYAQALDAHLRQRAAQGGARAQLSAALLWPAIHDGIDRAAPRPDGEWFRAAATAEPRDRLVAWRQAAGCQSYWPGCDAAGALAWLLDVAPDDMTVQLVALNAAQERGDAAAATAHLHAAAQATARATPMLELGREFVASTAGLQAPALDAQVAAALGREYELNRPATAADHAGILAVAVWAAQPLPAYLPLSRMCEAGAALPAAQRDDCVRVMARLAESPVLIEAMIGAVRSVRLAGEGETAAAARERLRRLCWLQQNAQRLGADSTAAPLPNDYLQRFLAEGEIPALVLVLQANELAPAPPAGWLPEDPRMRALVTGVDVRPAAAPAGG